MKSKKAINSYEMLMWVPRVIFLVVVMFVIMTLIKTYVTTTIDVSELQANVFTNRLLYSPNGISYLDQEINRIMPGIIDIEKFKQEKDAKENFLEKNIFYGNNNREIAAKLKLDNLNEKQEYILFYNEKFFEEQSIIADSGFTEGPGGARKYTKIYDVVIYDQIDHSQGVLRIEVVIPNS